MNKKKKIIPEFRFPEFLDKGEWEYFNGNKLFEPISNKDHKSDLQVLAITQEHGAIPRELINYTVIASKKSIGGYKIVEIGDFVISLRSFQGGIEYSVYKGICSPAYIVLRKKVELEDLFYKFYFKTDLFIQQLNKNLEGIRDGKMVSYSQFSDILIPLPSIKEQKKVASFLSSLDELIASQSDKLETFKEHKKGLMQNLFPREGQKEPKYRFLEFKNKTRWKNKKLGDITNVVSKRNKKNNKLPIYSINNKKGFLLQAEQFKDLNSNKRGYDISLYKVIERNMFAYNPARINTGSIGYSGELHNVIISSLYVCFNTTQEIDDMFLLQFFDSFYFKKEVANNVEGGIRNYLFYENFSNISISFPEIQEQKKIAFCLSALDELIILQENKIEQLQQHKKGLMQGLFPKIES